MKRKKIASWDEEYGVADSSKVCKLFAVTNTYRTANSEIQGRPTSLTSTKQANLFLKNQKWRFEEGSKRKLYISFKRDRRKTSMIETSLRASFKLFQ